MPPQISDDERSVSDTSEQEFEKPVKEQGKEEESEPAEELKVESDEEGDEEQAEDEYVVEKILKHSFDEEGVLRFQVKWEGYEKKSDMTWEPEENLETAQDILNAYLETVGGKEQLIEQYNAKRAEAAEAAEKKRSKKRGRPSAGVSTPQSNGKRSRKNGHPASSTPPASREAVSFKPPQGSWEDDVVTIEAMEGPNAEVIVYLTWKGGAKSQHPLHQVYKRCPQKMLSFYERHLVFKKTEEES
ncbi:putative heterochromatin protein one protein [Botrytis fragariae]|uniref:Putative heterochromatin protein one protein n=1 Tax=Botrytis fragariae TaxID=1964551 RepID=A0A8H6AM38_9HELO|nr:putative heterochromatin protein one protein [Botrytis fragariae]KAF5870278.1 putative heterochromatin protein one protein [Botrytis fragariae]